jgi:hypothetical protein
MILTTLAGAHLQCVPKNSQRRSLNISTFAQPFENANHLPYRTTLKTTKNET